jgi:hypothetical protein
MREESSIVGASIGPLAVVLLASAFGAQDGTAVRLGLYSVVVLLAGWAVVAGRHSRLQGLELTAYAAVGTLFGGAVVLLEVLLH